jgi:choline dehydrogenase
MTIFEGERESAARALLSAPLKTLSNFYFMRKTLVTKVLATKDAATGAVLVTGVSVNTKIDSCKTFDIKASREVILAAGAYGSPQILQRSGIGKASDLSSCGIPQLKELPVGQNLKDHPATVNYFKMPGNDTSDAFKAFFYWSLAAVRYVLPGHSGYFPNVGITSYTGLVNVDNRSLPNPNIQLIFGKFEQNIVDFELMMKKNFGLKDAFADKLVTINNDHTVIQVYTDLIAATSKGSVRFRSCSDPYAAPIINGNYLSDSSDVDLMKKGMKEMCMLFNTPAMINAKVTPIVFDIPECAGLVFCTDAFNACYMKYFTTSMWHPSGTCKMGSSESDSVVDAKLQVFGVKRGLTAISTNPMLRVADASIFPNTAGTMGLCAAFTVGEKAAALIIADNP